MSGRARVRLSALCLGAPLLLLAAVGTQAQQALDARLGKQRVLLLFASAATDPRVMRFDDSLRRDLCPLRARRLMLGHIYAAGLGNIGGMPVEPKVAAELRERFKVAPDQFMIVLVGRDGLAQLEREQMPPLAELFAAIDALPASATEPPVPACPAPPVDRQPGAVD
jgi:hypothetical protein